MNDRDVFAGQPGDGFRGRDRSGLLHERLCDLLEGIGPPVWATGPTAAALHGFDGFALQVPFHVLVPRGRNIHRVGHVVHTSRAIPLIDQARVGIVPVTSPTRTLLMLAAIDRADRVTAALDSALRDGGTSEDFLHRRINALRRSGRDGIAAMLRVIDGAEVTRGGHSWLEREFLRLVAAAGLPAPRTQQVLARRKDSLIRVDAHFADTNVVVEVLGYRFHRTKHQTMVDAQRLNQLQLAGHRVLQFTYPEIVEHPDDVVAVLVAALTPNVLVTARR